MSTFAQVRSWSASGAGDAADQLAACVKRLSDILHDFEDQASPKGSGRARDSADGAHKDIAVSLQSYLEQIQKAKLVVTATEGTVKAISTDAHAVVDAASLDQFTIDESGAVHDLHPPPFFREPGDAVRFVIDRKLKQDRLAAEVNMILARADRVDAALVTSITDVAKIAEEVGEQDAGNTQGSLPPEVIAAWGSMSDQERRTVLQNLADEYADRYGIPRTTIQFEDLSDAEDGLDPNDPNSHIWRYGQWNEGTRTILIDSSDVSNATAAINVVAHEMRHAGQHEMARDASPNLIQQILTSWGLAEDPFQHPNVTREQAKEWGDNFNHYNRAPADPNDQDGWDAYRQQPVEVDARTVAEQEVNAMTLDRLNELRK